MTTTVFPAPALPCLPVRGSSAQFPVHRIYCVGRNFADHAREMGATVDRGNPVFFMKPADAIVPGGGRVPYPPGTRDLHHEVELVVALGRDAHGEVATADALSLVFGYGVGLDLTRRDLQAAAKAKGMPWDTAKGFDCSAPASELVPVAEAGPVSTRRLWLEVNGQLRQQSGLDQMVFTVADVIHELSRLYVLKAGDLVFMGTPAGVAALVPGDQFRAGVDGLVEFGGHIA
ncbi:MAG: fumarylacetoacetate hydrolase family protein [Arenimonas sp.]|uniref:fumarylacetoacetate hydrolase family protein n=1 Tax=Arenimonas sp. TaxID=1872635 RepID=UPI0025BA54CD|nr:fumarylacetoacetate hydrolase family protein [Arenimonas sp.]MBW8367651.1 fumarylacetoacetate hydrolase family protein [Arenimonas sp.]